MRRRRAFLTPPPPQFSRSLRPHNRPPSLSLPPLASSLADATPLAPAGLSPVPAYPISPRDNSHRSPLTSPSTPIVYVGAVLGWNNPTENGDASIGCKSLRRKPHKGDDILGSPPTDAESNTTNYAHISAHQKGTRSTCQVNPLRRNGKRGPFAFLHPDLTPYCFSSRNDCPCRHRGHRVGCGGDGLDSSGRRPVSRVASFRATSNPHTSKERPRPFIPTSMRPAFGTTATLLCNTILRSGLPRRIQPGQVCNSCPLESVLPPDSVRKVTRPAFPNPQPPAQSGLNRGVGNES